MELSIEEKNKIIDVWVSKVSFYGYLIAFDFMEAAFYLRVQHFIMRASFSRWNDFINFNLIKEDFYYLNNVFEDYFREREKLIEYMADNRIFFLENFYNKHSVNTDSSIKEFINLENEIK